MSKRSQRAAARSRAYGELWSIVDGAVGDALKTHPDYLTPKGMRSARTSVTKRVTGTVLSFAAQAARGRARDPAETDVGLSSRRPSGEAVRATSPGPHCVIGKIRFKRRTRYRAAQDFDITTSKLIHEIRNGKGRA